MPLRHYNSARRILTLPSVAFALGMPGYAVWAAEPTSGPAAIYAGPFSITPTLGMDLEWRDNIYLQENDKTDSWIFTARPEVTARAQDRNNFYQLQYKGKTSRYKEDSSNDRNNYFDNTLSADAFLALAERWEASAYASYAWLHEDRGTGLTEGAIGDFISEPVEYEQADVGGLVSYGSDVGRLEVSGSVMERRYQNFQDLTRSRDRDEYTLGVTFFYPIAPKTDIFLDYLYKDISYPNPFEQIPPLDSQENSLQAGVEWEITPNLKSTAQAGYIDKSFDSSERQDWDGIGWSLQLWMQPREQDTIVISGKRAPDETTLQGDFIKRESLTVDWTHDWSDRVYTNLSGTAGRDTYEGSLNDREDDIYNVTARVGYQFRRWASFYTSYAWDDKNSNADNLSYTGQTFTIGVDLSL